MKILTILIPSGDRLHVKDLLDDLSKIDHKFLNIKVIDWTENKKILYEKKKIYSYFKKKNNNLKIFFQKGTSKFKHDERITKFYNNKSKYILFISDDDRICLQNFPKILKYLNFNYSGLTLSFKNFKTYEDLKKNNLQKKILIKNFDIYKDINKIGFISCQIIKANLIHKVFKEEEKDLLISHFPLNFIILKIIKDYQNWKIINLNCIFNRVGNLEYYNQNNDNYLIRLKSEYLGYFIPIKKNFENLGSHKLKKIYKIIFFKNIISWLFLSIQNCGKFKTYKKIKNFRNIIAEPLIVKFVLIIFYISPVFLLQFVKQLRKIINIVLNNR